MRKTIISIFVVLVTLFLVLANMPTGMAALPGAGGTETAVGGGANDYWQFSYGRDSTYGVYIRNVDWIYEPATNSRDYYLGLLNIPWVWIKGYVYDLPGDNPSISGAWDTIYEHYIVTYTDEFTDGQDTFYMTIKIGLEHGTEANIKVTAYLTYPDPGEIPIEIAVRTDFDISSTLTNDEIWTYESDGEGGGQWEEYDSEVEFSYYCGPSPRLVDDEEHDSKIAIVEDGDTLFEDKTVVLTPYANPSLGDMVYVFVSNSNEYDGNPAQDDYMDDEDIDGYDICFWDLTDENDEPAVGSITIDYWLYLP